MLIFLAAASSADAATCSVPSTGHPNLTATFLLLNCTDIVVGADYRPDLEGSLTPTLRRSATLRVEGSASEVMELPRIDVIDNHLDAAVVVGVGAGFLLRGFRVDGATLAITGSELVDGYPWVESLMPAAVVGTHGAHVVLDGTIAEGFRDEAPVAVFQSALALHGVRFSDGDAGGVFALSRADGAVDVTIDGGSEFVDMSNVVGGAVMVDGCGLLESSECSAWDEAATLSIADTTFDGSFVGGFDTSTEAVPGLGGAVFATAAVVSITGSTFVDNVVEGEGGALFAFESAVEVSGTAFTGNEATDFGAESGYGGAISVYGGTLSVNGSAVDGPVFDGNRASGDGGALRSFGAAVSMTDTEVRGCSSDAACSEDHAVSGGGLSVVGVVLPDGLPELDLTDCTFTGLRATDGGGLWAYSADVVGSGVVFDSGLAGGSGGGVLALVTDVSLEASAFVGNEALLAGGAVYVDTATLVLTNPRIDDNRAGYAGGALAAFASSVQLKGDGSGDGALIGAHRNHADVAGGTIAAFGASTVVTVQDLAFTDGSAFSGSTAVLGERATLVMDGFEIRRDASDAVVAAGGAGVQLSRGAAYGLAGRLLDLEGGEASLSGVAVHDSGSDSIDGGAVRARGAVVDIADGAFLDDRGLHGGAVAYLEGSSGRVRGVRFVRNHALDGADVYVASPGSAGVSLERTTSCAAGGPVVAIEPGSAAGAVTMTNGWIVDAEDVGVRVGDGSGAVAIENVTVQTSADAVAFGLGPFSLKNAVLRAGGVGVSGTGSPDLSYNVYGAGAATRAGLEPGVGAVFEEATFVADVTPVGDACADDLPENAFWLDPTDRVARDAGDPAMLDAWPGNGRADAGAYGGPDADLPDRDADGFGADIDCDDADASVGWTAEGCDGVDDPPDTGQVWYTGGGGCDTSGTRLGTLASAGLLSFLVRRRHRHGACCTMPAGDGIV